MLIGVKSKIGPLFSFPLLNAVNILLISPPPQGVFVLLSLTFSSLIQGSSRYSVPLSVSDIFSLCSKYVQGVFGEE